MKNGRKFFIACWGMTLLTILLISSIVLVAFSKEVAALIGFGTVLAICPSAYMSANAMMRRNQNGE